MFKKGYKMIEIKNIRQKKYYLSLLSDICIAIEKFDNKDKEKFYKNMSKGALFFNVSEDLEVKDIVNDILN
jgi:hypothetical protein